MPVWDMPVRDRALGAATIWRFRGLSPMPSQSEEGQTILEFLGLPTETCREAFSDVASQVPGSLGKPYGQTLCALSAVSLEREKE